MGLVKAASALNLLHPLPETGVTEAFQTLLTRPGVRVERIVSDGQCSPPGFWYEQAWEEWVLILQGSGTVEFAEGPVWTLGAGDSLLIPAHCRHRVAHTAARTVWLALHFGEDPA
ncbi:MAG: cupin domain-containing protein [Uliginosibacterium sp.]|nr:cupin domain-containing protein [Uliginosibacterium sp.]